MPVSQRTSVMVSSTATKLRSEPPYRNDEMNEQAKGIRAATPNGHQKPDRKRGYEASRGNNNQRRFLKDGKDGKDKNSAALLAVRAAPLDSAH